LIRAFKKDAVMIKAAEDALTAFLDLPLKFGAICTEARAEAWRLQSYWLVMLADHIDSIIRNPGATSKDDISDALDLVALLSDKLDFVEFHMWHLKERLLNPHLTGGLRLNFGFENVCIELEDFVVHGLLEGFQLMRPLWMLSTREGYAHKLMYSIQKLLDDYIVHELPGGERVALRGREFVVDVGALRHDSPLPSLDLRPQTDLVQCEIRYLSESVWGGVWQSYCERVSVW
jgi:hypothetical protein